MENRIIKASVIIILFLFVMASFAIIAASSENIPALGKITNSTVNPLISDNTNTTEPYVKYTLVLTNNTLVKGNFLSANGLSPYQAAFDSSNGYVYVTNSGSNNVSVINGATNTVIDTISVGSFPWKAAFDSSNGYVYVTNYYSGSVGIISTTNQYDVTFTESGLPSGTSLSVTFNGKTESSTTGTITFSAYNGTYSYTIGPVAGYTLLPSSGSVTVNGNDVPVAITFISNIELYGIIGTIVAVAVIGPVLTIMRKKR